jgi:hypothetical protein
MHASPESVGVLIRLVADPAALAKAILYGAEVSLEGITQREVALCCRRPAAQGLLLVLFVPLLGHAGADSAIATNHSKTRSIIICFGSS